jgi:outer membrane protein assembly factor BamB
MNSGTVVLLVVWFALAGNLKADTTPAKKKIQRDEISCGIADIDQIRAGVLIMPTDPANVQSRRAALYRWWRLLWHQGYDMNAKGRAATWETLLSGRDATALEAVDEAYAAMEDLMANGTIIPEVAGTPGSSGPVTSTDWPVYHGIDGNQTGYSPDAGPSKGRIAWRIAKGNFWYATPVIEDGRVYTASPGTDVIAYCLDETTGEVIWNGRQFGTQVYETPGSIFSPVVSSGKVLATTGWWQADRHFVLNKQTGITEAQLAAGDAAGGKAEEFMVYQHNRWNVILADATTGKGVWRFESGGNLSGEPVLTESGVYAARQSGRVFRFQTDSNKPIWQRDLGVQLRGTPGVGCGRVYVGDTQRKLHALGTADGSKIWTFQAPAAESEPRAYQYFATAVEATILSLPDPNRVYVGAAGGYLYCLNAGTGTLIWKYKLSDWIRSKPVVLGDTVYVATLDAKLFALRDTGASAAELWQTPLGEHGFTADLVGNTNGILASGMDLVLYSVSPGTGSLQWRHSLIDGAWIDGTRHQADVFAGQYQASPVVVDGIVYIGGPDGFLSAHDVETGKRLWRFEARGRISATPCVAEKKVFIGQNARYMEYYAIDQKTGEPIWTIDDLGWATVGATAYHDGKIFVGTQSGWFYGIAASDGTICWKQQSKIPRQGFHTPPATDETKVYTGAHDGRYHAFHQADGSAAWSVDTSEKPDALSGGNPDSAGIVLWKNHAYVQKRGSLIAALNRDTGEAVWEWKQPANYLQNGAVAAYDNRIFGSVVRDVTAIPYLARIHAFRDVDHGGGELWSYGEAGGGGGLTAPVLADGKLICGSSAGVFMTCLNPDNGELIWRCYVGGPMEEAVPALYGNKVFSHHRNGYFFAIE